MSTDKALGLSQEGGSGSELVNSPDTSTHLDPLARAPSGQTAGQIAESGPRSWTEEDVLARLPIDQRFDQRFDQWSAPTPGQSHRRRRGSPVDSLDQVSGPAV